MDGIGDTLQLYSNIYMLKIGFELIEGFYNWRKCCLFTYFH